MTYERPNPPTTQTIYHPNHLLVKRAKPLRPRTHPIPSALVTTPPRRRPAHCRLANMASRTVPDRLAPFVDINAYSVREAIIACLSIFDEAMAMASNSPYDGQEMRAYYKRYHPEVQKLLERSKVIRGGCYGPYHPELQELFEQFKLWADSLGGAEKAGPSLASQLGSNTSELDMVKIFLRKLVDSLSFYITAPARGRVYLSFYTTAPARSREHLSQGLDDISQCIESLDRIVKLIPIIQMRRRRSDGIFHPDQGKNLAVYVNWLVKRDKWYKGQLHDIRKLLGHPNLVKTLDDPSNLPEAILEGLVPILRRLDLELMVLAGRIKKMRYGFDRVTLDTPAGIERLTLRSLPQYRCVSYSDVDTLLSWQQLRLPESILRELVPLLKYDGFKLAAIFMNHLPLPETILRDIAALTQVPRHRANCIALELVVVGRWNDCSESSESAAEILESGQHSARRAAFKILGKQASSSPGVPEAILRKVLALLRDPDAGTRIDAVSNMAPWPCLTEATLRDMRALLKDPNASVRVAAVSALDQQPCLAEATLQGMGALLKDPNDSVRAAAARALGGGGRPPLSGTILQDMVVLMKDPDRDSSARTAAVYALDRQPHLSDTILQSIGELLKEHDNDGVLEAAMHALGRRPPLSDMVLQDLGGLVRERHTNIRTAAVRALDQQPSLPDAIIEDIRDLLNKRDSTICRLAALHFFARRPGLPKAIVLRDMAHALRNGDDVTQQAAAVALGAHDDLPEAIVAALMETALHENWPMMSVRIAAIDALVQQRFLSDTMLRQLETLREYHSWFFSDATARALQKHREG
ncbi:hypothetical protein MAPG_02156 [Magnaporthiopsis poae ATCC 64411]|uniref:HEAT repeat domain-containing protein n=1 Tax=Magnaporthiopsis poae (strain ATCC 64411 / 73-15) TaxID=644358 RepID=A0A0C4DQL2_MAGP6|nr:hypothetical protein MAPG_02156 [Magnaporthiopsis poae ATCC 64411]